MESKVAYSGSCLVDVSVVYSISSFIENRKDTTGDNDVVVIIIHS